jgi:Lipopolysaccharide-assembly
LTPGAYRPPWTKGPGRLIVPRRGVLLHLIAGAMFLVCMTPAGCGYRFAGGPGDTPFPPELKTVVVESAVNNTTVAGIETELTDELRHEFALGTRLRPVRSAGDAILQTIIASYTDEPSAYKADGKELTRSGTLTVSCVLKRSDTSKVLWNRRLSSVHTYDVTDSISATLSNRRKAISSMIKDLIPRIHRSMYDDF